MVKTTHLPPRPPLHPDQLGRFLYDYDEEPISPRTSSAATHSSSSPSSSSSSSSSSPPPAAPSSSSSSSSQSPSSSLPPSSSSPPLHGGKTGGGGGGMGKGKGKGKGGTAGLGVVRAKTRARARASSSEKAAAQARLAMGAMAAFWVVVFWLFTVADGREAAEQQGGDGGGHRAAATMRRAVVCVAFVLVGGGIYLAFRLGQRSLARLEQQRRRGAGGGKGGGGVSGAGDRLAVVLVSHGGTVARGGNGRPLRPLPLHVKPVGGGGGMSGPIVKVGRWLAPAARRATPPPVLTPVLEGSCCDGSV